MKRTRRASLGAGTTETRTALVGAARRGRLRRGRDRVPNGRVVAS